MPGRILWNLKSWISHPYQGCSKTLPPKSRIMLECFFAIGDKKEARFLGKWHTTITLNDLNGSIAKASKGQIWLLAQSPIIHLGANNIDSADKMVNLAISCGFKNSGIKSLTKKFIVEICSTERLDTPVGRDGKIFCNDNHLKLLVDISNEIYNKSRFKLEKFYKNMQSFKYL